MSSSRRSRQRARRPGLLVVWLLAVCSCSSWHGVPSAAAAPANKKANEPQVERLRGVRAVWERQRPLTAPADIAAHRRAAWEMFDHGFSHYMRHAFPKDNLMPISCAGEDWQGGLALTLVDSLDALLLLNRRSDLAAAVETLRGALHFDVDASVHVFETTIRVLGGLLSGHALLAADPGLVPGYDGALLAHAEDLGRRLLAAFDTPSGLPGGHVHLQKGLIAGDNHSCTACAGTLLLEFGLLSRLTGDTRFRDVADHAARLLWARRSRLGLVGSSFHVGASTWSHLGATIGPGSDSYYEYLLKAYLMFGERAYLDMFIDLYVGAMTHMRLPGPLPDLAAARAKAAANAGAAGGRGKGSSSAAAPAPSPAFGSAFLVDVHMDSGRLLKPWVSSLGAFWPAMQVLAGQSDDAKALHTNFTAAWETWGWLPEVFGLDLSAVHPADPGYNLRPEHIESTWHLAALTGDPGGRYAGLAGAMLRVLNHSRTECGYAPISDVATGGHTDLMESYFLSETVKYLYLSFVDSGPLLDYAVLSTEGHVLPSFPHPGDQHVQDAEFLSLAADEAEEINRQRRAARGSGGKGSSGGGGSGGSSGGTCPGDDSGGAAPADGGSCPSPAASNLTQPAADDDRELGLADMSLLGGLLAALPANCRPLCGLRTPHEEAAVERRLRGALPLLPLSRAGSRRIRYRRCVACVETTAALAATPQQPMAEQLARFNFGQTSASAAAPHDADARQATPGQQQQQQQQRGAAQGRRRRGAASAAFGAPPVATDVEALPSTADAAVLAQALCVLVPGRKGAPLGCGLLRPVSALDAAAVLPESAVILQLSGFQPNAPGLSGTALLLSFESEDAGGPATLHIGGAAADFGPEPPLLSDGCMSALLAAPPRLEALPACPAPLQPVDPYWRPVWGGSLHARVGPWMLGVWAAQQAAQLAADPWLIMSPSADTCARLAAQQQEQEQAGTPAAAAADVEAGKSAAKGRPAGAAATPALLGACSGYDPAVEGPGSWLPLASFLQPGGSCASNATAAAARAGELWLPSRGALPLTAPVVLVQPSHGCVPPANAASLAGAIAVVRRGGCSFLDKAMVLSQAGASGLVLLNGEAQGVLVMSDDGSGREPDMPATMLAAADSAALLWWLERRPVLGTLVRHSAPPEPGHGRLTPLHSHQAAQRRAAGEEHAAAAEGAAADKEAGPASRGSSPHSQKQQQQQHDGGDAAAAAAPEEELLHTRIDLFVPGRTQVWLQQALAKSGSSAQATYQAVIRDPRVLEALKAALVQNRAHSAGQPRTPQQQHPELLESADKVSMGSKHNNE